MEKSHFDWPSFRGARQLRSHQQKLPEADFGVEGFEPAEVVRIVRQILHDER